MSELLLTDMQIDDWFMRGTWHAQTDEWGEGGSPVVDVSEVRALLETIRKIYETDRTQQAALAAQAGRTIEAQAARIAELERRIEQMESLPF